MVNKVSGITFISHTTIFFFFVGPILPFLASTCVALPSHPNLVQRANAGAYAIVSPDPLNEAAPKTKPNPSLSQFSDGNYYVGVKFGDGDKARPAKYETYGPDYWYQYLELKTRSTAGKEIERKTLATFNDLPNYVTRCKSCTDGRKEWYYIYLGKDRTKAFNKAKKITDLIKKEFPVMGTGKAKDLDGTKWLDTIDAFAKVFNDTVKASPIKE